MNRALIILISVLAVVAVAAFVVGLLIMRASPSQTPLSPSPKQPTQTEPPLSVPQDMKTPDAVQAAYLKQQSLNSAPQVKKVVIVNDYALLIWTKDPAGGEALLKYTGQDWRLLDDTGGRFSVAALNEMGVPQKTVLALHSGLSQ